MDSSLEHIGFIAQEVQKIIPEAVNEDKDGYLSINTDPILWAMLNATHDQQREIEKLKLENKELKARLEKIEKLLGVKTET